MYCLEATVDDYIFVVLLVKLTSNWRENIVCSGTFSPARSEQFSESAARGKL